ncbi:MULTISPECIES: hypothetical protein [unclassified Romboutsia]|uniref:hypothetical protein n=1 Tax=unclassified Romboutsia TaxID=2626894 RepID=UPI000820CAFE|nr:MULTISPECIES: hypothetical protein [unclassified Romboutsia]SCH97929.1 Uncharacterised protein [uncultured Clostridium sp.]
MRWILVFIFLYVIPLIILFRNYKNLKRSCIYGSIYVVLVTTIAISNVYMSGLSKIEESLYYKNSDIDQRYKEKYESNFDNSMKNNIAREENKEKENKDKSVSKIEDEKINMETEKDESVIKNNKVTDLEKLDEFKKDIYDIERVALIPMRECIPYTKDIAKSLSKISQIKDDILYAQEMCRDVIDIYESMDIPSLSKGEYELVLSNARDDVKKAYELREKAMENAVKLLETKNPKYIGKITEYLKLSDNHISSFKEKVTDLKEEINEE